MHLLSKTKVFSFAIFLFLSSSILSYAQVVANFNSNLVSGCAPLIVQFSDLSTGSPNTWQWNLGNSVNSTQQNPTTVYTVPGTYTVTLTATNGTSSNTKTIVAYITVYASPNVQFIASDSGLVCAPKTITFTNQSTGANNPSYLWNFGDGVTSSLSNPTHTYANLGTYSVSLLITTNNGCSKILTKTNYITLIDQPNAAFTASLTSACVAPLLTTFTATSNQSNVSYNWDFGDNTSGIGNPISHTYTSIGNYTIKLIATNTAGCADTIIQSNYITISAPTASFTVGSNLCQNQAVSFTNTSSPTGGTYTWNFGDGTSSTQANPSHSYTNPGTYMVKLLAQNGTCIDSFLQTIIIKPSPNASFTAAPTSPCTAPGIVNFTNTSTGSGISNYLWSFGDGATSILNSPSHTYTSFNQFTVQLTVTNNVGCSSTSTANNLISIQQPIDSLLISNTKFCTPFTTSFSLSTSNTSPVSSYAWSLGNAQNATIANPTTTYTTAGTYTINLNYTLANGCSYSKQRTINVIASPIISFSANPTTVCIGSPVVFTNASSSGTAYTWNFGDGTTTASNANSITHSYTDTGTYTIMLIGSNGGCVDTLKQNNLIHVNPPKALFSFALVNCSDRKTILFTNNSIGATSCLWNFGDGSTSTLSNPTHTYTTNGTYTVILKAMNSVTGCIHYDTLTVPIFNLITQFSGTTTSCKQALCTYTALANTNYSNYTWYWGDGTSTSSTSNVNSHAYADTGMYTIKLVISDIYNCKDSITLANYTTVYGSYVNFSSPVLYGCAPLTVFFTNQSVAALGANIINYAWDYGNTLSGNGINGNTTYPQGGSYSVKLVVTESHNCKDSVVKLNYIQVNKPIPKFSVNKLIACNQENLYFTDSSIGTNLSYFWSFGDGTFSTSANPTHAYLLNGWYTVKLKITDNLGCSDSIIKTNFIQINGAKSMFIASDTFASCPPLVVNLTNTSINSNASIWNFGNGANSTLQNPSIIYTSPGTYIIKLISTSTIGCIDSSFKTIIVNGPTGTFSYSPLNTCAPAGIVFTALTNNAQSLLWDFSNGVTVTTPGNTNSYTYTYNQVGHYMPKLVMSDGANCVIVLYGNDTIKVEKTIAKFGVSDSVFCKSGTVLFSDSSTTTNGFISNYYWNFGDGTTSSVSNPTHLYANPGVYTVMLITSSSVGCADTAFKTINILEGNNISLASNLFLCEGQGKTVSINSNSNSINWYPATGLSCSNCSAPFVNPLVSTSYTIIASNANGCIDTAYLVVSVQAKLPSSIDSNKTICLGDSIRLNASGGTSYTWSPAAYLSNTQINNPLAFPPSTTIYYVAIHQGVCTFDTLQLTLSVNPKPILIAGTSQTITAGASVQLSASGSNIDFYTWTPATTLSCSTCATPIANPSENTVYYITVSNVFGCTANDSVNIKIRCENSQVFLPNTFTPNGDGLNDVFAVRGVGIKNILSFKIYSKWGILLFERTNFSANDYSNGWDGTFNNTPLSNDIFIYTVDAICITGDLIQVKGDIALIK
ncbi:MAG: hypothetical protein RL624_1726 [Bacteroidota bacterium]|jgi:gliding motility-associated-like protein